MGSHLTSLEANVAGIQGAIEREKRNIEWCTGQLCGITDKSTIELRKREIKERRAKIAVLRERLKRAKEELREYKKRK